MKQQTHSEDTTESRRRKTTSGESFSFPSTPNPDSNFEFGSLTPDSPSSDPCITSPADHLFFNGRLQPHSFPLFHPPNHHHHYSISTASRTSSISSKDSLISSRSNSINSRGSSSCSSSARTSASDSSERRLLHSKLSSLSSSSSPLSPSCKGVYIGKRTMVSAHHQVYGCSQRWQYITPLPALNRDAWKKRTANVKPKKKKKEEKKTSKKKILKNNNNNNNKEKKKVRLRFGRKILRWFVMACRECHAMEPSKIKKKHIMSQENVNN